MRIKIKLGDIEKDIEVHTKKKQEDAFIDIFEDLKKKIDKKDGQELKLTREFIDFENNMAVECSPLTQEEYDDLYSEDRNKIKAAIRKMVFPQGGSDPSNFFQG